MSDVECPYCGAKEDICHDDGYGYGEDETYQQECGECGKIFAYTTSISFYYETYKAPCMNGSEHNWQEMRGSPPGYLSNYHRCKWCDEQYLINSKLRYDYDSDSWIKKEGE